MNYNTLYVQNIETQNNRQLDLRVVCAIIGEYTVLWEYIRQVPNSDLGDGWTGGEGCQTLLRKKVTCRLKPVRRTKVRKHNSD